jgi:purine nucleosidase
MAISAPTQTAPEKVTIDTDIGDDIDDAFAVALKSPELQILAIATTFGDAEARAKILDLILGESGRSDIPVLAGTPRTPAIL